jgi:hypothetical protein
MLTETLLEHFNISKHIDINLITESIIYLPTPSKTKETVIIITDTIHFYEMGEFINNNIPLQKLLKMVLTPEEILLYTHLYSFGTIELYKQMKSDPHFKNTRITIY